MLSRAGISPAEISADMNSGDSFIVGHRLKPIGSSPQPVSALN